MNAEQRVIDKFYDSNATIHEITEKRCDFIVALYSSEADVVH